MQCGSCLLSGLFLRLITFCAVGGARVSVGYGLGRLRLSEIISHLKKRKGRGSRLDLENRNQCKYSDEWKQRSVCCWHWRILTRRWMHSWVLRLCGRYHTLNPCLAGHAVRIFLLGMERFMYRYLKRFGMCHPSHTHTHPFNGPLSGTTRVSRYQKGKTNLDFTEARDSEWQWHQLGHMQVCTSLQTDNHASTPLLSHCSSVCHPSTHSKRTLYTFKTCTSKLLLYF